LLNQDAPQDSSFLPPPTSPQEDQEIAQMVNKLFQKSRSWRENWAKDWVRFWNYWESNHYKHFLN
jgi:hypothetical protein